MKITLPQNKLVVIHMSCCPCQQWNENRSSCVNMSFAIASLKIEIRFHLLLRPRLHENDNYRSRGQPKSRLLCSERRGGIGGAQYARRQKKEPKYARSHKKAKIRQTPVSKNKLKSENFLCNSQNPTSCREVSVGWHNY